MYAVRLSSGQSLTVPNQYSGLQPLVYNGPGTGTLTVILTEAQYASLSSTALSGVTDVSNPSTNMLHITIPAAAGTICVGTFNYCGFSATSAAASAFQIVDLNGSGTGAPGTAAASQILDPVAIGAGGYASTWYGGVSVPGSGNFQGGIPVSAGPQGGLGVAGITGTYTGVVRICGR